MSIGFGILIVLFNLYTLVKDRDKGILLFVVLSMVSPVYYLSGVALSYDYLFLPFLILWALQHGVISIRRMSKPVFLLLLYFLWVLCITIISSMGNQGNVTIFPLVGTIKYIIIFLILSKEKVLYSRYCDVWRIVIFINCIAMITEFIMMQFMSTQRVVELWIKLFTTQGSSGSLSYMLEFGSIGRLYGTFASSAFPATISVLGIGLFLNEYSVSKEWKTIWSIIGCLFIGFASSTKRFFLGAVLIVAVFYLLRPIFNKDSVNRDRRVSIKFIFLVLGIIGGIYIAYTGFKDVLNIDYYLDYLLSGRFIEAFSTRFGNEGVVNSMIPVIKKNLFTGVGELTLPGVNVTDSMLYVTLYKSGIIGLICFTALLIYLIQNVIRTRSMYLVLTLGVIVLEFFISTEFFSPVGITMLAYAAHANHYDKIRDC